MPFKVTADDVVAVTLKVFVSTLAVSVALLGYGCDAERRPSTPISPSPPVTHAPPPPTPDPSAPGELWSLTTTIVSVEGSACFWSQPVGAKIDNWTLAVDRSGTQVRLLYDVYNPHDNVLFVGVVDDQSFTAVSDSYRSGWQCSGGVTFSSSVAGRFSLDGRSLSGRERLIYRLDRGDELIITLEWNAVPK